mgnify:CR=1 FL=1
MSIVLKLTAKKGKPVLRGINHYWSVIQGFEAAGQSFTIGDIRAVSEAHPSDVADFLRRLEKAGIIERTGSCIVALTGNETPTYRALLRQSATPRIRRDGTVLTGATRQQCMWNAMRSPLGRSGFTARDISAYALNGATKVNVTTANSYILLLARAGYLVVLEKGGPARLTTYRLAPDMNTGPLPPMILRTKIVFDQNRHEVVGDVVAEEIE